MPRPKAKAPGLSAQTIDAYLVSKNSPIAGQGASFMEFGKLYDIDPRLLVAVAGAETQFGNAITWGQYNAWNWGWNVKHQKDSPFNSWATGIKSVAHGLTKPGSVYNLTSSVTMYQKYCKGACAEGQKNLATFMNEQGAVSDKLGFPDTTATPP